ncbi:MAG TPA: histone deacetylase [Oceanobacillus sp.]|nr:histone deacetylase [Oceanobacillus sp.]
MTTAYVTHPRYPEHDLPYHPEHAGRIRAVWRRLEETGLINRLLSLQAQPISDEQILSIHTPEYLALLETIPTFDRTVRLDADTYACPTSNEIARLSAGGVTMAVDSVLRGEAKNGIAAVRPPGHHAEPNRGMGFCLLSNVAIAARHAQKQYGVERIIIVDYDVHHGNGTEAAFYDDPSILFISTHQSPLYPGTGAVGDTGTDKGEGFTINIPLPANTGDTGYAAVYEQIVVPAAERFKPELVLVSAGYDAHWLDPLAGMRLSLTGYAHLGSTLIQIADQHCDGKIVFVMEGGYNLDALADGICNVARLLLGEPIEDPLGPPDDPRREPDISALIQQIRQVHHLSD